MVLEVAYKAAFPTIHLLQSAGLTGGVSTATCEAILSNVVRILKPYRRCMTHERTVSTKFSRNPGSMPKTYTYVLSTWGKCKVAFLMKSLRGCGSTVLTGITKTSSKKIEVLCLSRRPRQFAASERQYTAAGGDVRVPWGGIH